MEWRAEGRQHAHDAVDVGVGQETDQSLTDNFEEVTGEHADGPQIHRIVEGVPVRPLGFHHLEDTLRQRARNQTLPAEGVQSDNAQGAAGSGNTHPRAPQRRQFPKGLDGVLKIQSGVHPGETGPDAGCSEDLVLTHHGTGMGEGGLGAGLADPGFKDDYGFVTVHPGCRAQKGMPFFKAFDVEGNDLGLGVLLQIFQDFHKPDVGGVT